MPILTRDLPKFSSPFDIVLVIPSETICDCEFFFTLTHNSTAIPFDSKGE